MCKEPEEKKSVNYEVHFCRCGRVHFIDHEELCKICCADKELLFICNTCGAVTRMGFGDYRNLSAWYEYDMENEELNDLSKIGTIIMSTGTKIPMETGAEATEMRFGKFIDSETEKTEDVSDKEWKETRARVNTQLLIRMLNDEDKLNCLSDCVVGIDWSKTKYCR